MVPFMYCSARRTATPLFLAKLPKGELISGFQKQAVNHLGKKWVHLTQFLITGHLNYLKGSEEEKDINAGSLLVCSITPC